MNALSLPDPMLPQPFVVRRVERDTSDTFTLTLQPEAKGGFIFAPGQFNMLYADGVGEVPISSAATRAIRKSWCIRCGSWVT
jgi:NAD(P)H-flavin reductase